MSLIYNATFDKNTRKLSFEDKAGNEIYSFIVPERAPAVDDITKPLTFRATQDGSTVKLTKKGSPVGAFQTSTDGGNTWTDYTVNNYGSGASITLNTGDEVAFRAKEDRTEQTVSGPYFQFEMTGKIEAWHNVMSMLRTNDFATYNTATSFAFYRLFQYCISLTKAPVLPATKLSDSCYFDMFGECGSLTKAPELPATALAKSCYNGIFYNCDSLTESPVLSATTLADDCFGYMFSGCRNLNEVHCQMPSSYSSSQISSFAKDWLRGVSLRGTFYTNADAKWPSGTSGIPTSWTRVNEGAPTVDDPNKPLMLRAIEDNSSVTLKRNGTLSNTYQTSTDGTNWTDYTLGTEISLNKGESVYFRCSNHPTTQTGYDYVSFVMAGRIEAWHNAYSMISSDFSSAEESVGDYGMNGLFEFCSSLTKAPLLLNALSPYCYIGTFVRCESLTKAPLLPATALAEGCYHQMFRSCYNLKEVRISATTTAASAFYLWLENVAATGDFYCDPNAKIFPTDSASGIPQNWNRHTLADYPATP